MFDHSRLTRHESLLLRVFMTVVAGCFGFILLTTQMMLLDAMVTDDVVTGKAVPAPKPFTGGSQCFGVDWHELNDQGTPYTPLDLNRDGMIDCGSDIELGS